MSFKTASAISKNFGSARMAGSEAMNRACASLTGEASAVMLFASTVFDYQEVIAGIHDEQPGVPIVGCSSAGVIAGDGVYEESLALLAIQSDSVQFIPIKVTDISQDMHAAGEAFGTAVQQAADGEPKLAFIFSDALSGNGTALVRGALSVLGAQFPLVGGAAADDMQFKDTRQYFNDEVLKDAVVGYAVYGDVKFAVGADHGWQPIGNTRNITKAERTKLIELDGRPAFEMYQDYFGERASDFKSALSLAAVSYPLGMRSGGQEQYMIRVPLAVNDDGSLVCGAELIEGAEISLMIGTTSSAQWAAESTAKRLSDATVNVSPRLVFISNCVARKVLYGERLAEEIHSIQQLVGKEATVFGFYSYGQVGPLQETVKDVNTCDPGFYEQSISVSILGE